MLTDFADTRRIDLTELSNGRVVSTVRLMTAVDGMDYETKVFPKNSWEALETRHYPTHGRALLGHFGMTLKWKSR